LLFFFPRLAIVLLPLFPLLRQPGLFAVVGHAGQRRIQIIDPHAVAAAQLAIHQVGRHGRLEPIGLPLTQREATTRQREFPRRHAQHFPRPQPNLEAERQDFVEVPRRRLLPRGLALGCFFPKLGNSSRVISGTIAAQI